MKQDGRASDVNNFQDHLDELLKWVHQIQESMEAAAKRRSIKLMHASSFISYVGGLVFVLDSSMLRAYGIEFSSETSTSSSALTDLQVYDAATNATQDNLQARLRSQGEAQQIL
jgi:uncharacterized membrane protein